MRMRMDGRLEAEGTTGERACRDGDVGWWWWSAAERRVEWKEGRMTDGRVSVHSVIKRRSMPRGSVGATWPERGLRQAARWRGTGHR
jgi:hypothetical protein